MSLRLIRPPYRHKKISIFPPGSFGGDPGEQHVYYETDFADLDGGFLRDFIRVGPNIMTVSCAAGDCRMIGGGGSVDATLFLSTRLSGVVPAGPLRSQFARGTTVSDGTNGSGLVVCGKTGLTATSFRGYILQMQAGSTRYNLRKITSQTAITDLSVGAAATRANNDIFELQAIIGSSSTVLNVIRNGTQIDTFTDSSSPFLDGLPGLGYRTNVAAPNASVWDNWSGGTYPKIIV